MFDTEQSLASSVAQYLLEGEARQEGLLVVATARHWSAIHDVLTAGTPLSPSRLTVLDADLLLSRISRRGQPQRAQFTQIVGGLVVSLLREFDGKLRIYGEMVELLARDRNCAAAAELERFWNELGALHRFTLLCGYSAAHFAGPDAGTSLAAICRMHSKAAAPSEDPLGQFLLDREMADRASCSPPPAAPRRSISAGVPRV